ncbi:MAG: hypothetical protein FJ147_21105 [Deltaproteobacteria bacterium]|nr:hypothetical protein [Deltaproteobacteria bacterium]
MPRRLVQAEIDFLARYFGESLDTDTIRVAATRGRRAYSIRGSHIRLPRPCFADRDTIAAVDLMNPWAAATLAHEATHVWQRQRGVWVTLKGAWLQLGDQCGRDPYAYNREESNPTRMFLQFFHGNIERQGQIVEDLVFADQTGQEAPQFSEIHAYLLSAAFRQAVPPTLATES